MKKVINTIRELKQNLLQIGLSIVIAWAVSSATYAHEQSFDEMDNSPEFVERIEHIIVGFIEKQNRIRESAEQRSQQANTARIPKVDVDIDHIRGDISAEYSLIEYSDYECPFCKRFHPTATEFEQQHDEVNWVYRHYPLEFHNPLAALEAEAAECAALQGGDDAFWAYSDLIYANTKSNGKGLTTKDLSNFAGQLNLDMNEFKTCTDTHATADRLNRDVLAGRAASISGTPANYLRHNETGATVEITGARPIEALNAALEALKAKIAK